MSDINWSLPADLFGGVNALLAALPEVKPVEIKIERPVEELLSSIDLGGFSMQVREISDADLEVLTASLAAGSALSAQGRAFALYIEDRTGRLPTTDPKDLPRVHIVNCGMTARREGRYVMVVNPSGSFPVTFAGGRVRGRIMGRQRVDCNLAICGLCKKVLSAQGNGSVGKFHLAGRLPMWDPTQWGAWNRHIASGTASGSGSARPVSMSPPSVEGVRQAGMTPADNMGYVESWPEISRAKREAASWTCSDCGVVCAAGVLRRFLDTHHVNRNKQDNTDANLRVLCRLCHREQGFHSSPSGTDDHKFLVSQDAEGWEVCCSAIMAARAAQGIARARPANFIVNQPSARRSNP